ncbi:YfiM family protein [Flavobacteriales bacterium]|nr:YfiM family protein [Flavobacteriales bacterium]
MNRLFLILFLFPFFALNAQDWMIPRVSNDWEIEKTHTINKKRRNILLISEVTAYTVALVGLNELWYADYPKSNFHFINDNREWLQMDKIGHLTSSYHIGVAGIKAYKWTGMSHNNAVWYGGMSGSFFLTIIEILDGYSAEWGASSGDLIANTSGSLLAIGQELKWKEQRVQLKYSYTPSKWAEVNSEQLGENHLERTLKDYNGQTYWLSFNMKSLLNIEEEEFPGWLNLAIGYSGDSMTNPYHERGDDQRKRQYLFSLDVDLTRIDTKSKILNSILHTFGFLKFPMPTLELSNGSLSEYLIYY